jgi:hypothetical protein
MEYLQLKCIASQAEIIAAYKNLKTILMKWKSNIYFNKQYLDQKPYVIYHNTGLFEIIVGVLTTCHTQYTWDRSM